MPTPALQAFATQAHKSVGEVGKLWNKAKGVAKDMGEGDNFAYITGVLKSMLGLDEQAVVGMLGTAYAEAACGCGCDGDDNANELQFVSDYDAFMQKHENEGPMVSTSFAGVLPETPPKKKPGEV